MEIADFNVCTSTDRSLYLLPSKLFRLNVSYLLLRKMVSWEQIVRARLRELGIPELDVIEGVSKKWGQYCGDGNRIEGLIIGIFAEVEDQLATEEGQSWCGRRISWRPRAPHNRPAI